MFNVLKNNRDNALVPKPSGAVEKAALGRKHILSRMVTDALDLARKISNNEVKATNAQLEDWFQTGEKYRYGQGVPQSYTEAVKWFRMAAEKGYVKAQYSLGSCYLFGDFLNGVPKNETEAVKWFRKAAGQGYAYAQVALGYRYYAGEGVEQDYVTAAKWYRKAADQNNALAQTRLGSCYYEGVGIPQDYAEALKWWSKAAKQNYVEAQYFLGRCYQNGQGISPDTIEAYKFYKLAAGQRNVTTASVEHSCKAAAENLKQIVAQMTADEIAEGERRFRESNISKLEPSQ